MILTKFLEELKIKDSIVKKYFFIMYNIYTLYGIIHIVEGKMENIEEKKCECGCDKEHCDDSCDCCHDEPMVLEMEDVNGEKVNVQVVGSFDDNDKSYAIVSDLDDGESYYIFEIQTTDEGDMLVSIDDEDEFDRLCKVVESKLSENN